ncbi:MAG: hypothetical protein ACR2M9_00285 [Cyanophyceae cyanobacterium]
MAIKVLDNITSLVVDNTTTSNDIVAGTVQISKDYVSANKNPGVTGKFQATDVQNRITHLLTFENGLLVDFVEVKEER